MYRPQTFTQTSSILRTLHSSANHSPLHYPFHQVNLVFKLCAASPSSDADPPIFLVNFSLHKLCHREQFTMCWWYCRWYTSFHLISRALIQLYISDTNQQTNDVIKKRVRTHTERESECIWTKQAKSYDSSVKERSERVLFALWNETNWKGNSKLMFPAD